MTRCRQLLLMLLLPVFNPFGLALLTQDPISHAEWTKAFDHQKEFAKKGIKSLLEISVAKSDMFLPQTTCNKAYFDINIFRLIFRRKVHINCVKKCSNYLEKNQIGQIELFSIQI